jgi:broad specificity phosphatase PhoE
MSLEVVYSRILLVRHGHYERTGDHGDTVWGLTPLGRRQAARTGRRLVQLIESAQGKFEGLFASPWPRALQTAEIAAHELNIDRIKVKPYLHEVLPLLDIDKIAEFGAHPGLPFTTPEERVMTVKQIERVRERFFRAPRTTSFCVIFTHGNLIRYLVTNTLRLPYEAWSRFDCSHCGITELRVYPEGFEALISYNDTGHLPTSLITTA